MRYRHRVKILWPYISCIIFLFPFALEAREPIWHPQETGTSMSDFIVNCDGIHKAAYWAEHAGFTLQIYDSSTFNDLSRAPQVQIDLDEDPIHLQNRDFTIQTRVKLNTPDVDSYFAGLYVHFDDGETLMFGRAGLNSLRLEYKGSIVWEQAYSGDVVYVKIKRLSNRYTVWFSEDCQIWTPMGTELIEAIPVFAGTVLRNWGAPQAVEVEFKHFDIMHVENEPDEFVPNYWYGEDPNECLHFIYDLSGIDVVFHIYMRQATQSPPIYSDRKLYFVNSSMFNAVINQNLLHPTDKTGAMNLMLIAPILFDGPHPYFNHHFGYRWLWGEEDWMYIDLHENYIRERFPASQSGLDDKFYLTGSSAGGQFVNRFCMAHAKKLHAALPRAAGGITFPTYDIYWAKGLDTSVYAAQRNPRLKPDLESLASLKLASVVGENDNEVYWPIQPIKYSAWDGMRKWIRQLKAVCGDINGDVFICPFSGHGYGYRSRRLMLYYFFGSPIDFQEFTPWKYTFEVNDQDRVKYVSAVDVPDHVFYFHRFTNWSMPWGSCIECYTFYPEGLCHVSDDSGIFLRESNWSIQRVNGDLYIDIDGFLFHTPTKLYGMLRLQNEDKTFMLEQSAFVTKRFIDDCVVNRTFYVFEGIGRDPNGPLAIPASAYPPFKLQQNGSVIEAQTSLAYPVNTMRHWSFQQDRALLQFSNEAGNMYDHLQIGEWRWHISDSGIELIAGLHTRKSTDTPKFEIRTDQDYDPRCFEEWEYSWPSGQYDTAKTIYVDHDAQGNQDGTSWENAMIDLQDALHIANFGDTIHVAEGYYYPASSNSGRDVSFALVEGVTLKGGYAGFGAQNPNARDVHIYETVLSGDLQRNDEPGFLNREDNCYHVLTATNVSSMTVLDGFTISGGNANVSKMPLDAGGGLRNDNAHPVIKNCTFRDNYANWGGAITNRYSSPIIVNSQLFNNRANNGGAVNTLHASPLMRNCLFYNNHASRRGGALYSREEGNTCLTNCTVVDNISNNGAGALFGGTQAKITNCIFWQNKNLAGTNNVEQIRNDNSSIETFYNCIQGGIDISNGEGNIVSDPLFKDVNLNNYHIQTGSPCIDAGDQDYEPEADERDLDGRPRINSGRIDMGAYEYYSNNVN